jgi:hypothetical protein
LRHRPTLATEPTSRMKWRLRSGVLDWSRPVWAQPACSAAISFESVRRVLYGVAGGIRATAQLRLALAELQVATVGAPYASRSRTRGPPATAEPGVSGRRPTPASRGGHRIDHQAAAITRLPPRSEFPCRRSYLGLRARIRNS